MSPDSARSDAMQEGTEFLAERANAHRCVEYYVRHGMATLTFLVLNEMVHTMDAPKFQL